MRLWIDGQCLQTASRFRGIGRYVVGLLGAMTRSPRNHEIIVSLNASLSETAPDASAAVMAAMPSCTVHFWQSAATDGEGLGGFGTPRQLSELALSHHARVRRPDFCLSLSPFEGQYDAAVPYLGASDDPVPWGAIFYDAIPSRFPDKYLPHPADRDYYGRRCARLAAADSILAISQFAASEAKQCLALSPTSRVTSVDAGISSGFMATLNDIKISSRLNAARAPKSPSLLYVGGLDWRKNVWSVVDAIAELPDSLGKEMQFVCVGDAHPTLHGELQRHWNSKGLPPHNLVIEGFLPDEELIGRYLNASVAIQPSLMEGFGLTVLEAMHCGCPVIASKEGALPEVVGLSEALFDPKDRRSIARAIERAFCDEEFRAKSTHEGLKRATNFSWERSASLAWDAIEASVARFNEGRRRRVILVSAALPDHLDTEPALSALRLRLSAAARLTHVIAGENKSTAPDSTTLEQALALGEPRAASWIFFLPERLDTKFRKIAAQFPDIAVFGEKEAVTGPPWSFATHCPLSSTDVELVAREALFPLRANRDLTASRLPEVVDAAYLAEVLAVAECCETSPNRLFVDVSYISQEDQGTGIQRVVRSITRELLRSPPRGFEVATVTCIDDSGFLTKPSYGAKLLGRAECGRDGCDVRFSAGDVVLMLDSSWLHVDDYYKHLVNAKAAGAKVVFVLYDLIPIKFPAFCDGPLTDAYVNWFEKAVRLADSWACISRAVACELMELLQAVSDKQSTSVKVGHWALGADFQGKVPVRTRSSTNATKAFLMVGTVEPRKGHEVVLDAAELLWADGIEFELWIAGRVGWNVDPLVERIRALSNTDGRLRFLESPTDESLVELYSEASAVICASYAEGFGLPIIEAAHFGLPVIASDISVFREVAGESATFFKPGDARDAARCLNVFLKKADSIPRASSLPTTTWQESARDLADLVLHERWTLKEISHKKERFTHPSANHSHSMTRPLRPTERKGSISMVGHSRRPPTVDSLLVTVRVANDSSAVWTSRGSPDGRYGVTLGSCVLDDDDALLYIDTPRARIPFALVPGDALVINLSIPAAPIKNGGRIKICLVQEGVCWFPWGLVLHLSNLTSAEPT